MYRNVKNYELRYTDVDFKDELKLSALLSLMEESACASADELGFGYSFLQTQGLGFVLTNWHIELNRSIKLGETLTIRTWPVKPKRLIVLRDFDFFVGDEKVGVATSRWCVVDMLQYKIVDSSRAFSKEVEYNDFRSVVVDDWKIPHVLSNDCAYEKKVTYSDYDHYNHVNNTKYGDFLFDVFSPDYLSDKFYSCVDVSYREQCKVGEIIEFFKDETPSCVVVEGRVSGSPRVQMRVVFKNEV